MLYSSVKSESVLRGANRQLINQLRNAATRTWKKQPVTFRPSKRVVEVSWLQTAGFWFGAVPEDGHYWISFGRTEPDGNKALNITVEVNTPLEERHGRAGLILQDTTGTLFLAHTGRVGGGKPDVNRTQFLAFHGANAPDLIEYDGAKLAILLGRIGAPALIRKLSQFIREVERFKSGDTGPAVRLPPEGARIFQPKFTGEVTYKKRGEVIAELLHDVVVSALKVKLEPNECFYSQRRDLFICTDDGTMSALFEIKTDCSTSSVYAGVGQLLLNGLTQRRRPKLLLVIPGVPDESTKNAFRKLGISVLPYRWAGKNPVFLEDCLTLI